MENKPITRRTVVGLAGTALAVGLAGCADGDGGTNVTTPSGNATVEGTPAEGEDGGPMLRVGHMAASAPAVDVDLDGETVVEGLSFADVTPYQSVESGSTQMTVTPAEGEGEPVFDEEVELGDGAQTAVALGELEQSGDGGSDGSDNASGNATTGTGDETNATGDDDANASGNETNGTGSGTTDGAGTNPEFTVELFEDDMELPSEDTAKVRLIHAVPDAPPVSVSADVGGTGDATGNETNATGDNETTGGTGDGSGQTSLFESVAFGEASEYAEAPAGSVTLDIAVASDSSSSDGTNATGTSTGNETDGGAAADGGSVGSAQIDLDGETVYTVFATGYLAPGEAPSDEELQLVLSVDASPEMGTGTTGDGNETNGTDDNETGGADDNETGGADSGTNTTDNET